MPLDVVRATLGPLCLRDGSKSQCRQSKISSGTEPEAPSWPMVCSPLSNWSSAYVSPLECFKTSFFRPAHEQTIRAAPLTHINRIDPVKIWCPHDLHDACLVADCPFQHLSDVKMSDEDRLQFVISRLVALGGANGSQKASDIMTFLYQRLSKDNLLGLPIQDILEKLVEIRPEISARCISVAPDSGRPSCSGQPDTRPLDAKIDMDFLASKLIGMPPSYFFPFTQYFQRGAFDSLLGLLGDAEPNSAEAALGKLLEQLRATDASQRQHAFMEHVPSLLANFPESHLLCLCVLDVAFSALPTNDALDCLASAILLHPDLYILRWIRFIKASSIGEKLAAMDAIVDRCESGSGTQPCLALSTWCI